MEKHKPASDTSCPVDKALNVVREAKVGIDAAFARIQALTGTTRGQTVAVAKAK